MAKKGAGKRGLPRTGEEFPSTVRFAGQEPVPPETGIKKIDGRWFGSSLMTIAGVRMRLVYFGINEQFGHHSFPYHQHDYAELALTLKGHGQLLAGPPGEERIIECAPGDLYVVPGSYRHGARWDCEGGDPWEIILLQFELDVQKEDSFYRQDQSLALQFAPFYEFFFTQRRFHFPLREPVRRRAFRVSEMLRQSLEEEPELAPVAILNYWLWLIAHVSYALKSQRLADGEGIVVPLRDRDMRMEKARAMLADPASWSLPLPEVARAVGMSLYHFIRAFRARYGLPPKHYRNQCVIQCAGRLLAHTDEPIYLIADKCGYESPSAFAKAFQRHTGLSPMDYRARFSNPPTVARSRRGSS